MHIKAGTEVVTELIIKAGSEVVTESTEVCLLLKWSCNRNAY